MPSEWDAEFECAKTRFGYFFDILQITRYF